MCVIIIKDNDKRISADIIKSSARINPDGLGVVWLDDYSVEYFKSNQHKVLNTERPFIAHFRYATMGKVCKENTHPFVCGDNADELLMMNGTIKELGDVDTCDTKVLAEILGNNPRHTWKGMLSKHFCRFVTINTRKKTYEVYNDDLWTEHDGSLYSKSNVLEVNYIAVYGTLKYNYSNYLYYLSDSYFVGSGETKDKYPLVINGLPFLIEKKGLGHNVAVDVFKVTDDTLARLDKLEGHPRWYKRKQIPINIGGSIVKCWIYFSQSEPHQGQHYHKSYIQNYKKFTIPSYAKPLPPVKQTAMECQSCLEWYDVEEDESEFCNECKHWIKEFYDGI